METKARVRIYTEDIPAYRDNVERLVAGYTNGATFTQVRGLWMGQAESSLVIEIICDRFEAASMARSLCGDLRAMLKQEAVLFFIEHVEAELVVKPKDANDDEFVLTYNTRKPPLNHPIDYNDEAINDVLVSKIEEMLVERGFVSVVLALKEACLRLSSSYHSVGENRMWWNRALRVGELTDDR